jgi:hypothetical protein
LHFNTSQGSHTLYLYANNTNGIISENVTFFINSSIFLINSSEYESPNKGISTNLNQYSYDEIQNLSNLTLEHTAFGKIQFNERINLTDDENESDDQMNIDEYTNISSNRIEINSTALPNFNKSATLWLYGLTFTNPRILRGRAVCPSTTCIKESYSGGVLKFNVTHFTVYSTEETPAETPSAGTSSAGTGAEVPGIPECTQNSECKEKEVCWHNKCTQLFDIKILNFESPVELGSFFEFTYLIKGMANINDDVGVSFWIERQGKKITSGSDTIYIGSFEEKTESSKIFLPNEVESGVYEFYVEVIHKAYNAKSHRTIEITVKGGEAEITFMRFEGLKTYATIIIGLLSVLILLILFRSVIKLKRVKVSEIKEAVQQPESQIQPAKPELKKAILLHNRASRVNLLNSIKVFFLRVAYRTRYLKLRISPVFKKITRRIKRKLRRQKERERAKLVHNEISRMNLLQIIKVLLLRISYQIKITAIKLSYLVKKITKK